MTPAWILDVLAAVMLVVAAVSAARLVAVRPWRPGSVVIDTDVAHLLMAIAMAGMLTSSLSTLPDIAWEVIFGLMTAWFAVRVALDARANGASALARGHCVPHLVHSAAMLYMFLALTTAAAGTGMSAMAGMPSGSGSMLTLSYPTLALIFALILGGYSVWDLDRLSGRRPGLTAARVSLAGVGVTGVGTMTTTGPGVAALPRTRSAGTAQGTGAAQDASVAQDAGAEENAGTAQDTRAAQDASVAQDTGEHRAEATDCQAVWRGEGVGRDAGDSARLLLSPGVTVGCRIAMGVVMAFLLIVAI